MAVWAAIKHHVYTRKHEGSVEPLLRNGQTARNQCIINIHNRIHLATHFCFLRFPDFRLTSPRLGKSEIGAPHTAGQNRSGSNSPPSAPKRVP